MLPLGADLPPLGIKNLKRIWRSHGSCEWQPEWGILQSGMAAYTQFYAFGTIKANERRSLIMLAIFTTTGINDMRSLNF
ncbi:hypothetical protein [Stenotrophomonas acidaminiphila]|uniref:hypothetical protein n=1 Tax=Stenotrophomonas acidaminiphila TaxID=128780 RepID=UPI001FAEC23A|nr:hypothetical protein [Stenotrophomonas acidaminiphila]